MSQPGLRTLSVVMFVLLLGVMTYNLYSVYQSMSVCHGQLARLDALDAQIDHLKR